MKTQHSNWTDRTPQSPKRRLGHAPDVSNSNWTGRVPRSVQEAFGPYAGKGGVWTDDEPLSGAEKAVIAACTVAAFTVIAIILIWG